MEENINLRLDRILLELLDILSKMESILMANQKLILEEFNKEEKRNRKQSVER